jgi:uncharacterized protein DUF3617
MALQGYCRLVAAFVLVLGTHSIFAADAPPTGDLWQVTSKMSMQGMPMEMPAHVGQVCAAKTWTHPPGGNDQNKCKRTDFQMVGDTATWTESCEAPPMTGRGKITRQGADAYTGSITFESPQGNMTINLDGHRVGGCDNPN